MDTAPYEQFAHTTDLAAVFDGLVREEEDRPLLFAPDRVATRRQIAALAADLADRPAADAWPAGSVVALALANGPGFLAALLAVWRRSCTALLLDCDTPFDRCVGTARAMGAITLIRCPEPWPASARPFEWTGIRSPHQGETRTETPTAVIKLTSGTTGTPRGILFHPRAIAADTFALEEAMGIDATDRIVAAVPMSFSYGFASLALPALLRGRELVVPNPENPLAVLPAARRREATILPSVPVFLGALLRRDPSWELPPRLRLVISAGAPLSATVARQFRERFGLPIHVFYGASECGGISYDRRGDAALRGTVGTPLPGVQVELDRGVVTVRSPAVASAFLPADRGIDRGRFVSDDEGRWKDGELQLSGRRGEVINIGGHKVNPRELERIIADLPGVDAVHVTALPEAAGRAVTCCAVVESRDASVSRSQVHEWCLGQMPAFKLPRRILVVRELPRSSRGKVETAALHRLVVPDDSSTSTA